MSNRFQAAIAEFVVANSRDPIVEIVDGVSHPGAVLYAQRMSKMLARLAPKASGALRLATRCQHVCRWEIPSDCHPPFPKSASGSPVE